MRVFRYFFLWLGLLSGLFALKHFYSGFLWYYIQDVYPVFRKLTHFIFDLFNFSVGDILYTLLLLFFLYRFFRWFITIFRGDFWLSLSKLLTPLLAAVFFFYLFWGLLYDYKDTMSRLGLEQIKLENKEEQLQNLSEQALQKALLWREKLSLSDSNEVATYTFLYEDLKREVEQCATHFSKTYLKKELPVSIKKSSIPSLVSYMKSSGYYNPLTGEAHLNTDILKVQQPFTACHEIAHQLGFAREQEANLIGFLICMQSDIPIFRYSAYLTVFRYALYNLRRSGDTTFYKEILSKVPPSVWVDLKAISAFWKKYDGVLDRATTVVFDAYLKSNGQGQGIKSYTLWIELLMQYQYQNRPE